jgi:putative FmdB family regulatory protein
MAIYGYKCLDDEDCGIEFDKKRPMSESEDAQPCVQCEGETKKLVVACGIVFKGDGWATKNGRVAGQMRARRDQATRRQEARVRDGSTPGGKLVPNVGGEITDTWQEAGKLAESQGKDSTGFEVQAVKEKKLKKRTTSKTN